MRRLYRPAGTRMLGFGGGCVNDTQARHTEGTIEWEYRVPLLTSRFMLWDFARVIGLSVAIMYALVAVTGWCVDGEFVILPPVVLAVTASVMTALFAIASLLLGNRFTMTFSVGPDGVSYESGARERRINRVVAVLGGARQAAMPEVPTFAELGLAGFEDVPFYGFFAPAGTPQAVIDAFGAALARVVAMAEVRERMTALGLTVGFMPQKQFAARERAYAQTWAKIIRDSGFQPQ